jgi:hypothetical protein
MQKKELFMKKFILAAATLALISSVSLADQSPENMNRVEEMRKMKFEMMMQMNESHMEMLKMQEAMLTNYQKLLKTMMENELNSH